MERKPWKMWTSRAWLRRDQGGAGARELEDAAELKYKWGGLAGASTVVFVLTRILFIAIILVFIQAAYF